MPQRSRVFFLLLLRLLLSSSSFSSFSSACLLTYKYKICNSETVGLLELQYPWMQSGSSQILQSHQVPTPPKFTAEMSVGLFFLESCLYQTFMVTGKGLKKLCLSLWRTINFYLTFSFSFSFSFFLCMVACVY